MAGLMPDRGAWPALPYGAWAPTRRTLHMAVAPVTGLWLATPTLRAAGVVVA